MTLEANLGRQMYVKCNPCIEHPTLDGAYISIMPVQNSNGGNLIFPLAEEVIPIDKKTGLVRIYPFYESGLEVRARVKDVIDANAFFIIPKKFIVYRDDSQRFFPAA